MADQAKISNGVVFVDNASGHRGELVAAMVIATGTGTKVDLELHPRPGTWRHSTVRFWNRSSRNYEYLVTHNVDHEPGSWHWPGE